MNTVDQEFEDYNPDAFNQFLKNICGDKWPDIPEDPAYRIDDFWKPGTTLKTMYAVNRTADANPFSNQQTININNSTLTTNASSININNQRSNNTTLGDFGFICDDVVGRENLNTNQIKSNPFVEDGGDAIP
jgi:hypothetical protein